MPQVRVVCNWQLKYPNELSDKIVRQFVYKGSFDPEITFTETDDYDFLFIFNGLPGRFAIKTGPDQVFGFILEPPFYTDFYDRNIGSYCNRVYTCCDQKYYSSNENFCSSPSLMFNNIAGNADIFRSNHNFTKPGKLSFCVSNLKGNEMYDFRRELVYRILESDLDCDIYGSGWEINDLRYKGRPADKGEALLPYEYSIAVENSIYDGYVSEKLFDCFLCNTVPLYYGTPTVDSVYNPASLLKLPFTGDYESLVNWLRELARQPPKSNFKFRNAVLESKERYLTKYSIYNLIKKIVKSEKR
jgi:hypothetical protein